MLIHLLSLVALQTVWLSFFCGTEKTLYKLFLLVTIYLLNAVGFLFHHNTFTFTFSHLADAFIQSDLQLGVHEAINLEEANIQRKCQ